MSRVLVAPDAFKGSLSSVEIAAALAEGWCRGRPDDEVRQIPLSDGGEGLLDALVAAGGWDVSSAGTVDPLGRSLDARYLVADDGGGGHDGGRAAVELAEASGLSRVAEGERDPEAASTRGTGVLLAAAIDAGCRRIVLGIGGSATTDGGSGLLAALGARFLGPDDQPLPPGGGALARLARVDLFGLRSDLREVAFTLASDVQNPLLGRDGAAAVYGPQKGADPDQVHSLDAALGHYADVLEAATGRSERDTPGAGAAGGTAFGLLEIADRFGSFEIRPGIEVVMELTGFADALSAADLVLTGEGRVDEQTAHGKTAMGVARRARDAGRPCLVFGGGVTPEGIADLAEAGAIVIPVAEAPGSVEAAIAAGTAPIVRAAERSARLVSIGLVST